MANGKKKKTPKKQRQAKASSPKPKTATPGKRELARAQRAEENIITTICGNTSPGQRKVSTEWVALASGTRSVEKVQEVAKKFGLKVNEKEIDLSGIANLGKAYGEIVKKRQKELDEYLTRREEQKKKASSLKSKSTSTTVRRRNVRNKKSN